MFERECSGGLGVRLVGCLRTFKISSNLRTQRRTEAVLKTFVKHSTTRCKHLLTNPRL